MADQTEIIYNSIDKRTDNYDCAFIIEAEVAVETINALLAEYYDVLRSYAKVGSEASYAEIEEGLKGKIPTEFLNNMKRDFVVNKVLADILNRYDMHPALSPGMHILEYPEVDKPYNVDISIVESPHVTLTSYEPVEVQADLIVVTDRLVATRVAEVLDRFATYEDAEPRRVKMGDVIRVNIMTTKDGQKIPRLTGNKMLLDVDPDAMPMGFIQGLIGMNVGESKVITYEVKRDRAISDEDKDSYIAEVTIMSQQKKIEVDLTDEWVAEHYPNVGTVDAFFAEARKDLENEARLENQDTIAHLANVELEKRLQGSIPDAFYSAASSNHYNKLEDELKQKGQTIDDYLESEQMNEEELSIRILAKCGEGLRQAFALEAFFDGKGWELTDEDRKDAYIKLFGNSKPYDEGVLNRTGKLHLVEQAAKRVKAITWLVQTAKVTPYED